MAGLKTFAIDIGGTRIKIGLVDMLLGKIGLMVVTPTENKDGSRFLAQISDAIRQFKKKPPATKRRWRVWASVYPVSFLPTGRLIRPMAFWYLWKTTR